MTLRAALDRALDLALPARCSGCGREGDPICPACAPALDARLELPAGIPIGLVSDIPPPLLQLEWCAPFEGLARRALHALKYSGERRLARPLGDAVARRWAQAGAGGDLLVPVPVHKARLHQRGYDQAQLIADAAAPRLRLPVVPILQRARATAPQYELGRDERSANVESAFRVVTGVPRSLGAWPLAGRWAILVDDVVTTGATLVACAVPLLEAGAIGVSAVTVAREQ